MQKHVYVKQKLHLRVVGKYCFSRLYRSNVFLFALCNFQVGLVASVGSGLPIGKEVSLIRNSAVV